LETPFLFIFFLFFFFLFHLRVLWLVAFVFF
jgi:hypothetical protein